MNSEHPMTDRVVYRSLMADNLRWDALQLRDGDIIISAPSKSGLTWTQRLVSLLVFDGPDLPGPLSTVSPWLDQTIRPIEEVVATLDAQQHPGSSRPTRRWTAWCSTTASATSA